MILSEPVVFALALADNGLLLFLLVYHVITLSDLECDYLNALECCSKLNRWVPIKIGAHVGLQVGFPRVIPTFKICLYNQFEVDLEHVKSHEIW